MALVGIELETLVYEPDALTTRPLLHISKSVSQFFVAKKSLFIHFTFLTSSDAASQ